MEGLLPADLAVALELEDAVDSFYRLPPPHQLDLMNWIARGDEVGDREHRINVALRMLVASRVHNAVSAPVD
ncbi:MAG: hypothetical protein ACRDJI_07755 [Actinomycetota bacterium]